MTIRRAGDACFATRGGECQGEELLVTVAAEAEASGVIDAIFGLEVEDDPLALAEHEEDASPEASGPEKHVLTVVVANDHSHFSGRIVYLDDTLHGPGV